MRRAVVIGGTGTIGRAVARRLLEHGWELELVGRDPSRLPADLTDRVRFVSADRAERQPMRDLLWPGAELMLDCACYTAGHARGLLALLGDVGSLVMISSKAVYVDAAGHHSNSALPPSFERPVTEAQPTLPPDESDGYIGPAYGACKSAAETVLLDSGYPVSVLRASKVHGEGARRPNEWAFVKRVLDGHTTVQLAHRGRSGDHPSAAVNIAALVETVAEHPGRRVLNVADPDAPTGLEIARIIASHPHHRWHEELLDDDADPAAGWHPWNRWPPVRLDTGAAQALGYTPVGDYRATVADTLDWLVSIAEPTPTGVRLPLGFDNSYFDRLPSS